MENKKTCQLIDNVLAWARARKIDQQEPATAFNKVNEEIGEIRTAMYTNNTHARDCLIDALGDTMVTLINLSHSLGLTRDQICHVFAISNKDQARFQETNQFYNNTGLFIDQSTDYLTHNSIDSLFVLGTLMSKSISRANHVKIEGFIALLKKYLWRLLLIANNYHINLFDCLASAYDVIKDRQGTIENNIFVKAADQDGKDHQE